MRPARIVSSRPGRLAVLYVVLIAAFVVTMTAVYALPQGRILKHARTSALLLRSEGPFPHPVLDHAAEGYWLDNYTDALMLDTSIATSGRGPLYDAMAGMKGTAAKGDTIAALSASAVGRRQDPSPYAYYWHGYQLLLRPALVLASYSYIRFFNILLLALLAFSVGASLLRAGGRVLAGAFLLSLAVGGFYVVPMSLQFSSVTYVTLLATLAVVTLHRRGLLDRFGVELLFVVGMLTSFVDLLTFPLLSLGMPLATVLALRGRDRPGLILRREGLAAAGMSAAWVVGYAGSWVTKWLLASVVLRTDVVRLGLAQVLFRTGADDKQSQILSALARNMLRLLPAIPADAPHKAMAAWNTSPYALLVPAALVVIALMLAFGRKPVAEARRALGVLWVAPGPYVWITVVSNHSKLHSWFTYRIQAIVVFAVTYALLASVDFDRLRRRLRLPAKAARAEAVAGLAGSDEESAQSEDNRVRRRLG